MLNECQEQTASSLSDEYAETMAMVSQNDVIYNLCKYQEVFHFKKKSEKGDVYKKKVILSLQVRTATID